MPRDSQFTEAMDKFVASEGEREQGFSVGPTDRQEPPTVPSITTMASLSYIYTKDGARYFVQDDQDHAIVLGNDFAAIDVAEELQGLVYEVESHARDKS